MVNAKIAKRDAIRARRAGEEPVLEQPTSIPDDSKATASAETVQVTESSTLPNPATIEGDGIVDRSALVEKASSTEAETVKDAAPAPKKRGNWLKRD